jgi:hypothetical protein
MSVTVTPVIVGMLAPVAKLAPVMVTSIVCPGAAASGVIEVTTGMGFSEDVVVKVTFEP